MTQLIKLQFHYSFNHLEKHEKYDNNIICKTVKLL